MIELYIRFEDYTFYLVLGFYLIVYLVKKKMGIVHSAFSISKTQALQHKLNHYSLKNTTFLYINVFLFLIVKLKTYLILLAKWCRIVRFLFFLIIIVRVS